MNLQTRIRSVKVLLIFQKWECGKLVQRFEQRVLRNSKVDIFEALFHGGGKTDLLALPLLIANLLPHMNIYSVRCVRIEWWSNKVALPFKQCFLEEPIATNYEDQFQDNILNKIKNCVLFWINIRENLMKVNLKYHMSTCNKWILVVVVCNVVMTQENAPTRRVMGLGSFCLSLIGYCSPYTFPIQCTESP